MKKINLRGFLLAAVLGLLAHFAAQYVGINGIMLGLILGLLIGNIYTLPPSFSAGVAYTGNKFLELSILFLAFGINFKHVALLGWQNFVLVIVMIVVLLILVVFLSKKLNCPRAAGYLVGFGSAICGSSAIAAISPSIEKKDEDVGVALAIVNLLGSIGMIILPYTLGFLKISNMDSGVLIGATLHSVGNVAGAGFAINNEVGDVAITIKMARVAMLSPSIIFFTYLINKGEDKNWKQYLNMPAYLWAFITITIFTSLVALPGAILGMLDLIGKVVLTIAMAAIGLRISFLHLYSSGKKVLGFGTLIFMIQVALVIVLLLVRF